MFTIDNLFKTLDKQLIWHPFTQAATAPDPLFIARSEGAYLYTGEGRPILDAISSWWVNLHGHNHPYIGERIARQAQNLSQIIFAGFTHEPALLCAEMLTQLLPPGLSRVFYSDNGSTAVEVALKMALQYWHNLGRPRTKVLAFHHSYHGDTFGAMSLGTRSSFTKAFWPLLFEVQFLNPPLRGTELVSAAELVKGINLDEVAAFIYEPLVQGSGGMLMHEHAALDELLKLLRAAGVICIADEVMTSFGRTGKVFASDFLGEKPDIICLAKGLTGGTLPLSVTVCREYIYEAFLSQEKMKAFFHGHSFTANALGCAAAIASMELLQKNGCVSAIENIASWHAEFADRLAQSKAGAAVCAVRQQGTILAFEFRTEHADGYFHPLRDRLAAFFLERGVLLRPLGNTVYIMPPYCVQKSDLAKAYEAIEAFAEELL